MPTDQEWADFKESIARRAGRISAVEAKLDGVTRMMWMMFLLMLAVLGAVLALPFLDRWYG